jgi:hypothetical protein
VLCGKINALHCEDSMKQAKEYSFHLESEAFCVKAWVWIVTNLLQMIIITNHSSRELYRPSDRRLSAKLVPIFADIGVLRLIPNSRKLDRSRYFSFLVAP